MEIFLHAVDPRPGVKHSFIHNFFRVEILVVKHQGISMLPNRHGQSYPENFPSLVYIAFPTPQRELQKMAFGFNRERTLSINPSQTLPPKVSSFPTRKQDVASCFLFLIAKRAVIRGQLHMSPPQVIPSRKSVLENSPRESTCSWGDFQSPNDLGSAVFRNRITLILKEIVGRLCGIVTSRIPPHVRQSWLEG